MAGAGIDDEPDVGLVHRQPRAVGRRRHAIGGADENERATPIPDGLGFKAVAAFYPAATRAPRSSPRTASAAWIRCCRLPCRSARTNGRA